MKGLMRDDSLFRNQEEDRFRKGLIYLNAQTPLKKKEGTYTVTLN